jgi:folate-binding protein YgfZ
MGRADLPTSVATPYLSGMSDAYAVILRERGIVEVAGADAASFLQGLITNDIAKVDAQHGIYAALLTPQGKVIYDFLIHAAPDGFYLDCVRTHAADLAGRLKKYKLRAKVTIADRSAELAAVALAADASLPESIEDPRVPALGRRAILPAADVERRLRALGYDLRPESEYQAHRLALGVPDAAADIPPETLFPLDCNFEELNGVDFAKGCYVGQELTARMKHRATARRRLLPVSAAEALPPTGTPLKIGSIEIGELRGAIGNKGMALVRLDRLGNVREASADGQTIVIGRPSYPLILPAGDDHQ